MQINRPRITDIRIMKTDLEHLKPRRASGCGWPRASLVETRAQIGLAHLNTIQGVVGHRSRRSLALKISERQSAPPY